MDKEKIIEKAISILKNVYNIPNKDLKKYKNYVKKTPKSYIFSNDKEQSFSRKAFFTFVSWYRHTKTPYDMDIRALNPEAMSRKELETQKQSLKSSYNRQAINYIHYQKAKKDGF